MDVQIGQLQSFLAIAQLGSFTQAAKQLHISQPALTGQIDQLETSLDDVRLLDRDIQPVQLTKLGKEVLPIAHRIIEDTEKLVLATRKTSYGKENIVKIAAIFSVASAVLPLAITNFYERHRGTLVQVADAFSDQVLTLVREQEVDFGIASLTTTPPDMQTSLLFRDRLSVVFSFEPRLAQKQVVQLRDLVELPLILMEPGTSNRRLLDRAFESISHPVRPRYEAAQITTAVAMAEAGLGVAVLPSTLFRGKQSPGLHVMPIQHDMLCREVVIVQKVGHSQSPDAEAFMTLLKSGQELSASEETMRPFRKTA